MAPHFWLKRQGGILSQILNPGPEPSPSVPVLSAPGNPRPTSSDPPAEPTNEEDPAPQTPTGQSTVSVNTSTSSTPTSSIRSTSTSGRAQPTSEVEEDTTPTGEEEPVDTGVSTDPLPIPIVTSSNVEPPPSTVFRETTLVLPGNAAENTGISNVGATANGGNAFLDNKVLSGVVFGICGLVGLIILIGIILLATRKARMNRKLEQEIISWDPDHTTNFHAKRDTSDTNSIDELEEKRRSPSSLDGPTYAYGLPNNQTNLNRSPSAFRQPINVALPTTYGQNQPHAQPYPLHQGW